MSTIRNVILAVALCVGHAGVAAAQDAPAGQVPPDIEPAYDEPADAAPSAEAAAPAVAPQTRTTPLRGTTGLLVLGGVVVAGLAGYGVHWRRNRSRSARHHADPPVPLFVPPGLASRSDGTAPRRMQRLDDELPVANGGGASTPVVPLFQFPPQQTAARPGYGSSRPAAVRQQYAPRPVQHRDLAVAPAQNITQEVRIGPVRFHAPPEGTLQMLPGRLEIISGTEHAEEIRFVRLPGRDPVITFGRSQGEPHAHIRLEALTVSRVHAAMHFRMDRWHIENLSRTNPVLVNGTAMAATNSGLVPLADGDVVEMGEVTFRFRER